MSKTLLNRLAMFEVLDIAGPLTMSELAQRSGMDLAVVSRTVRACERDGWLIRVHGQVAIGPRATLLGRSGPFAEVIDRAGPLVHAAAGVTGLACHAYSLMGDSAVLIALAPGRGPRVPVGLAARAPLYATAAGHAIATQLDPARLARLLPPEPFPDAAAIVAAMAETVTGSLFTPGQTAAAPPGPGPRPSLPAGRQEFQTQLDAVRRDGFAADPGRLDPAIDCLAVPWPQPGFPGALACLGPPDVMAASDGLVRAVLALAARPGGTPQQIVTGAAAALEEKRISGR